MNSTTASLKQAMEETALALEAEDSVSAAKAMERAVQACHESERQNIRLDETTLASLRELHQRCLEAADKLHVHLHTLMLQAGSSRKATDTYRGRSARSK